MQGDRIRILLVEDDPDDAFLLREMLAEVASIEFELAHVERLQEAVQRIGQEQFDVVLLDLSLPDSQGLATFAELHGRAVETPIVVLTGFDDETVAVTAVQEGAQDYLIKGQVGAPLLVRSMRYAIERQRTSHYRAALMERERLDTAVSHMSDGIIVTDGDWRVTTANRAACLLLNLPEDRWQGTLLDDALRPFTLSTSLDDMRASDQQARAFEISRPHTRPPLFIGARLNRRLDSGGQLESTVLTLRDVTDERREHALRASFFTMVSHKLRTPLTVLKACLYLCERLPPESATSRRTELMDVCRAEVERLTDVVQKLLDFKALTTHELEGESQSIEVQSAVVRAADGVRRRYPARQIELDAEIAPEAAHAACDTEHLELVLEKLLDNAAKFGDKDPVRIAVRAESEGPSKLRFSVSDNGPGIPHEYYDRIFDGFVQVEDRPTGQVPGLGVGLYMVRQVVEAYGGSISVHSRIGEGSTFSFTVPAAQPR